MTPLIPTNEYHTPTRRVALISRLFPSGSFYAHMVYLVFETIWATRRTGMQRQHYIHHTGKVIHALEVAGIRLHIEGLDHLKLLQGPGVFVSNHMSSLETFIFPCLIMPVVDTTFVMKRSLVTHPILKHVMVGLNPIAVGRTNPREDLEVMLREGTARLQSGLSVVVFPQATRTEEIHPNTFNSIGVKLARRANVPVLPIAVKTDAWGNGRWLKDFGRIDPRKPVHIAFGTPIEITGGGKAEHAQVVEFIAQKLQSWEGA